MRAVDYSSNNATRANPQGLPCFWVTYTYTYCIDFFFFFLFFSSIHHLLNMYLWLRVAPTRNHQCLVQAQRSTAHGPDHGHGQTRYQMPFAASLWHRSRRERHARPLNAVFKPPVELNPPTPLDSAQALYFSLLRSNM